MPMVLTTSTARVLHRPSEGRDGIGRRSGFLHLQSSDRVVSYKGLVMPADLERFYPDLNNPALETAICVFHQRFSTNTLPGGLSRSRLYAGSQRRDQHD